MSGSIAVSHTPTRSSNTSPSTTPTRRLTRLPTGTRLTAGTPSDKVGRRPLIIAGFVVFAAVYLGFALAAGKAAIWALFLLYGGYYTLTQGTQRAYAADLADPQQRAAQIGAFQTVVGVALLPASLIAGVLFGWHPAVPFAFGAVMAVAGALLLLCGPGSVRTHPG